MNYQVGDLVYWETQPEKTFTIEELDDKNLTYDRIWIWSSELDMPWTSSQNKNFHSPNSHTRGRLINLSEKQRQRNRKLEELGIE
jgi:hypothetical protein